MKIFKFIVCTILIALTLQMGYFALIYKATLATCCFAIVFALTGIVMCDGGLKSRYATNKK